MPFDLSGLMTIPQFRRDLNLAQAKGLMQQLLVGLEALDRMGIMHRDIKGKLWADKVLWTQLRIFWRAGMEF